MAGNVANLQEELFTNVVTVRGFTTLCSSLMSFYVLFQFSGIRYPLMHTPQNSQKQSGMSNLQKPH